MSLTAFVRRVVEVLDQAGVSYMLTGSLAAAYYAVPRATQDVDLVIETTELGVDRLVRDLLAAGWYVDRDAAVQAWRDRGQFNAIEPATGWKADFIVRKDRSYSEEEFRRRQRMSLIGLELTVASLEDVVISKLEWSKLGGSALQQRDVVQLVERTWSHLDREYLETWIARLGLDSEWQAVRSRANHPSTQDETER